LTPCGQTPTTRTAATEMGPVESAYGQGSHGCQLRSTRSAGCPFTLLKVEQDRIVLLPRGERGIHAPELGLPRIGLSVLARTGMGQSRWPAQASPASRARSTSTSKRSSTATSRTISAPSLGRRRSRGVPEARPVSPGRPRRGDPFGLALVRERSTSQMRRTAGTWRCRAGAEAESLTYVSRTLLTRVAVSG